MYRGEWEWGEEEGGYKLSKVIEEEVGSEGGRELVVRVSGMVYPGDDPPANTPPSPPPTSKDGSSSALL